MFGGVPYLIRFARLYKKLIEFNQFVLISPKNINRYSFLWAPSICYNFELLHPTPVLPMYTSYNKKPMRQKSTRHERFHLQRNTHVTSVK